jgi:DNA polymerase Ligase (LigD)
MPRFVVLAHDWPVPHLDLFVERDGVLKAWRLPIHFDPTVPCPAEVNVDHRLHYLDYEGPVSGDRGVVARWDRGAAVWERVEPGRVLVWFDGQRMSGDFELARRNETEWELRPAESTSLRVGLAAGA